MVEGGIHIYANGCDEESKGADNYESKWTVTRSAGPRLVRRGVCHTV